MKIITVKKIIPLLFCFLFGLQLKANDFNIFLNGIDPANETGVSNYVDYTIDDFTGNVYAIKGENLVIDFQNNVIDDYQFDFYIDYDSDGNFFGADEMLGSQILPSFTTGQIISPIPLQVSAGLKKLQVVAFNLSSGMSYVYEYPVLVLDDIAPYCLPEYTFNAPLANYISGVELGTISNLGSGNLYGPVYTDYTDTYSTTLTEGVSYELKIHSAIADNVVSQINTTVEAWIDYNDDNFFTSDEKLGQLYFDFQAVQSIFFEINTPVSPGPKRLRVRSTLGNNITSPGNSSTEECFLNSCGETEDYLVNVSGSYCIPEYNFPDAPLANYIAGVQFGAIDNMGVGSPNNPPLTDYTHLSTTVNAGDVVPLVVYSSLYDNYTGSSSIGTVVEAWIDYNNDGIFDPSESIAMGTYGSNTQLIFYVSIPSGVDGARVMRIRHTLSDFPGPCDINSCGEAHDYLVNIGGYCTPEYMFPTEPLENYIAGVQFGDINNLGTGSPTNSQPLWDYTSMSTTVSGGQTYQLVVFSSLIDNYNGLSTISTFVEAWIDYNDDGIFDPSEKIAEGAYVDESKLTFQVTIPGNVIGERRMRIRHSSNDYPGPCDINSCGEAEDYTVVIQECSLDAGDDVVLDLGNTTQLTADEGFATYDWSPGSLLSDSTIHNPVAFPTSSTIFTLTATSADGTCVATDTVVVDVVGSPGGEECSGNEQTMTITATVCLENQPVSSIGDSIYYFIGNDYRGSTNFIQSPIDTNLYLAFISVCGNSEDEGKKIKFKFKDESTGRLFGIVEKIDFESDGNIGTIINPEKLNARYNVMNFNFAQGYNWFSVGNLPGNGSYALNDIFNAGSGERNSSSNAGEYIPTDGDRIVSQNEGYAIYVISETYSGWFGTLTDLKSHQMYKLYTSTTGGSLTIEGTLVPDVPRQMVPGWNWLGAEEGESLSLGDALTSLNPSNNDLVKSQNEGYALYYNSPEFTGWVGTLDSIAPGKGYKLFLAQSGILERNSGDCNTAGFNNNMNLTGTVIDENGNDVGCEDCRIWALIDGECRGEIPFVTFLGDPLSWGQVQGNQEDEGKVVTFEFENATGQIWDILETSNLDYVNGLGDPFTPFIMRLGTPQMPVELKDFRVDAIGNNQVELKWITASEENNSHFDVERSFDGGNWEVVTTILGAGTTAIEQRYDYIDRPNMNGKMYYRLNQVDFDGKNEYSAIRTVELTGTDVKTLTMYPNPVKGNLFLEWNAVLGTESLITIYNMMGKTMLIIPVDDRQNQMNIDLSKLPKGTYFVELNDGNEKTVKRFSKL